MELDILAVAVAATVMFAVGGIWYTVIFRNAWARIMGFDKLSKQRQAELMSGMGLVYGLQLVVTLISATVLTYIIMNYPALPFYLVAFVLWLGFVLPTEISSVTFGRTEPKYKARQIVISSTESLLRLTLAAWVISLL